MQILPNILVILLAGFITHSSHAFKYSRATQRLTLELLIVADYSEFNKFYKQTSSSHSHTQRVQEAKHKLEEYVGALVHSSNYVYKKLESHQIYINLKLVDVLVMTTPSDSPWTETVKEHALSYYTVDPRDALPLFQKKSLSLQRTIPHDHAMILTYYDLLEHGDSESDVFSGYAYTEAECKPRSVSIVTDNDDFYTAQLIAHEIGHSLGCHHDGSGNSCPVGAGYTMETSWVKDNKNKWTFSSCSVTYIRNYINYLTTHHKNCLTTIDNSHPDTQVATATHEWYGQVYSADEQCQNHYGPDSYLCKNQYHGDMSRICLRLYCYKPSSHNCHYIDGGDGTPCGTGKWCMSNECVSQSGGQIVG